jgi:NADH dehydrogenase/NADH:ubiquinone oxidoreductase subunit G
MQTVTVNIDGRPLKVAVGSNVLAAALEHGLYIPHLCHDPALTPWGGCRLCLVVVEGMRGFPAACTTTVAEGMTVRTYSPELDQLRRDTLDLILAEHPQNCLTCPKNQHCELQRVTAYLGATERKLRRHEAAAEIDTSNPVFDLDYSYCIMCQRCTRACDELAHANIIEVINRGTASKVASFVDPATTQKICPSCRKCLPQCPVAALRPKS